MTRDAGFLLTPRDDSLEAFKGWIDGMYEALTGQSISEVQPMSEEEWIAQWRSFWAKKPTRLLED
jgi:hypothetical protein